MTAFMRWLRVELLRLRSFDWGSGSRRIHWLKDGVAKFDSYYVLSDLAKKIDVPEDEILRVIDSPAIINELEGKSFTLSWKEGRITLSWIEEGINEWMTHIAVDYCEENGGFFQKFRLITRFTYLDGSERIVSDTGEPKPISMTEESFKAASEQVHRNSPKQD